MSESIMFPSMTKGGGESRERTPNHCSNCTLRGGPQLSRQHAESLISLLEWHKGMIEAFHKSPCDKQGSEKGLTIAYCDELIEALKVKKGSEDVDGSRDTRS